MFLLLLLFLLLSLNVPSAVSQEVLPYPGDLQPLRSRWDWALGQAKQRAFHSGFWIVYSFDCWMAENEFVGTFYTDHIREKSLLELFTGQKALGHKDRSSQRVIKEIALLFRFDSASRIQDVAICHLDRWMPLQQRPVFWLRRTEAEESIAWLEALYGKTQERQVKLDLICAIGAHKNPGLTIPFLQRVLSEKSEELRGEAALWLALQEDVRVLAILRPYVEKETSQDAIETAMAGISEMKAPEATQLLIDWTDPRHRRQIRKAALLHLAEIAVEDAVNTIRNVAYRDSDAEVQKHALYALAEMEGDAGLEEIIRIAKTHPNPEIRKQAIYLLGDSDDPRARQTLLDIVASIQDH